MYAASEPKSSDSTSTSSSRPRKKDDMASAPRKGPRGPFSSNTKRKGTAKATSRLDPLRATALLFIAAGVILIISFFYSTSIAIEDQNRIDQAWRQQVVVPAVPPPRIDPALKHPVGGVDFAIQVPKLGYFAAVKEGISSGVLYSGPGHYPDTPWPGDQGTVGVAAHKVYSVDLPQLGVGVEVDLQTRYGLYRYRVTGDRIVELSDTT